MRVVRAFLGAIAIIMMTTPPISADVVTDIAESWVCYCNLIVEAETVAVHADTMLTSRGYCQFVSKIQLLPLLSIWGDAGGEPFEVLSSEFPADMKSAAALLEASPEIGPCGRTSSSLPADSPLPAPGDRGFYALNMNEGGRLWLNCIATRFARVADDHVVSVEFTDLRTMRTEFPAFARSDFLDALIRASHHTMASLRSSDIVLIGRLGSRKETSRESGRIRIPVKVERIIRGALAPTYTLLVDYSGSRTAQDYPEEFCRSSNVMSMRYEKLMLFGELVADNEFTLAGIGGLRVSGDSTTVFPQLIRVQNGFAYKTSTIRETEELLR